MKGHFQLVSFIIDALQHIHVAIINFHEEHEEIFTPILAIVQHKEIQGSKDPLFLAGDVPKLFEIFLDGFTYFLMNLKYTTIYFN